MPPLPVTATATDGADVTTHSLTLGSLLLTGSMPDADHGYELNVLAEGASFGAAKGVQGVVTSLLSDGDLVRITRYGNRDVTFSVEITGPSLVALAEGEAALRREVGRGNTLTWQPPDFLAAATVFEVVTSEMSQTFNDLDELARRRTFSVTLTCLPGARSLAPVTVEAISFGTSRVTIDTCDSAAGWTGTWAGAPRAIDTTFVDPGSLGVQEFENEVGFPPQKWTLTRTGTVDFTATPFLEVEVTTLSSKGGAPLNISASVGTFPGNLPKLLTVSIPGTSYYRVIFDARGAGVVGSITLSHVSDGGVWQGLIVRDVAMSNIPPNITPRQVSRFLEIGGTERTTGSVAVSSRDGSALSLAMVHTSPASGVRGASGYSPSLRPYRLSGNTVTTDAARLSGASEPLKPAAVVSQVPNGSLPDGPYFVAALVKSDTSKTTGIFWTVRTIVGGADIVGQEERGMSYPFTANVWALVPLGVISLPVAQATDAITRVDIQQDTLDAANLTLDDVYLFWAGENCGFTVVNGAKSRLWLDTPDASSLVPTYWTGDDELRGDAHHPGTALLVPGEHPLVPGLMRTWIATTGATATFPLASVTNYERWHSNAAR